MTHWLIWLPLLPFIGFLFNGFNAVLTAQGRLAAPRGLSQLVACLTPLLSFALALMAFLQLQSPEVTQISTGSLFNWVVLEQFSLSVGLVLDPLSSLMSLVVTGVGFLIHLYSTGYMHEDKHFARYFAYLNLFLFFMLTLIMGDSLLLLFVGWEGVGLCSYLLIGFWFTDEAKAKAGKKAFITNRVGDFFFLIGLFLIVAQFAQADTTMTNFLSFEFLQQNASYLFPVVFPITLCLFLGATGKSAQIPLYVWLPDAMAGPTPVSALIHAATMVTAGIYLIARLHFLFVLAPITMGIIATIGMATAFFAALVGVTQYDIKKVLAYSTVSQLGYMFLALGVGAFSSAIFHVFTHAFFKAGLFLCAGSVIHALHHEQDMRFMGGLLKKMPKTGFTYLIFTLAIAGVPPLAGFFSKDEILYMTYANPNTRSLFWIGLLTAGITAFYMMRSFVYTFLGNTRYAHPEKIHESPAAMTLPLIVLATLAVFAGLLGIPGMSWINNWLGFLGQKIPHHIEGSVLQEPHLMGISIVWALSCLTAAFVLYRKNLEWTLPYKRRFAGLHRLVSDKFRVDEIYETLIITPIQKLSESVLFRFVDRMIIDDFFVNGSAVTARFFGKLIGFVHNGLVSNYLLYLVCGLALTIALMMSW